MRAAPVLPKNPSPEFTIDLESSRTDIAERAYDLYQRRGRHDGHDLEDWLEAEQQLADERRKVIAPD